MQGADTYARDENGNFIVEGGGPGNPKMLRLFLELVRPEKWGKARKSKIVRSGGVLVIGEPAARPQNNCAASRKAKQWTSASRKVREEKPKEV